MKTIRTKLFFFFTLFTVVLVAAGILLNAVFLERYYIYKNKSIMEQTAGEISSEYTQRPGGIVPFINQIDRVDGINCTIADASLNAICNSFPEKQDSDARRLPGEIEQIIRENSVILQGGFIYQVIEKPTDEPPRLVFVSRMNAGEYIILKKSMKGIQESVAIANQFYVLAGLFIILAGGFSMFYFSKKLTAPIIEMSGVAESISNLDFNRKVGFDSADELGSLGRSINNMAEKLNNSLAALQQDVERRKQLVRNISHELKTPIGVVKGYAEGLKFGVAQDKDTGDRYCTVIAEECDRMDRLVQELLNLSMLESGTFQIQSFSLDLGGLVQICAERFAPVLEERGIQLEIRREGNLTVKGDQELLERIMNNFMINAIDHTDGAKRVEIGAENTGCAVRISVFNTGPAVPTAEMERIWDVFYKVDKARTRLYGGHGLGLSIVKLIAGLHGGTAGAFNLEDGVLFYADIPCSRTAKLPDEG